MVCRNCHTNGVDIPNYEKVNQHSGNNISFVGKIFVAVVHRVNYCSCAICTDNFSIASLYLLST